MSFWPGVGCWGKSRIRNPPDMGAGEMTAKGNLNYRKVLDRRKDLLARLYDDADTATITI